MSTAVRDLTILLDLTQARCEQSESFRSL